jgi:hypothetical protein
MEKPKYYTKSGMEIKIGDKVIDTQDEEGYQTRYTVVSFEKLAGNSKKNFPIDVTSDKGYTNSYRNGVLELDMSDTPLGLALEEKL